MLKLFNTNTKMKRTFMYKNVIVPNGVTLTIGYRAAVSINDNQSVVIVKSNGEAFVAGGISRVYTTCYAWENVLW